ncbi:universal stress protein [Pontibacter cellulosilyticus]|uniref:Universal stress protein n=1 Tax=Pontibacter cellulosilyticus TaxID=1720253 RepID=A0A923N306_9BACT|nr:universal stress protein [Pontibacter cellulosilyticus]MBC5991950.1 universal stress protein [Pontibacter cellulosilyticus]
MKTFLVPTDFSDSSLRALNHACRLAIEVDAKVILCHIYDKSALPSFGIAREKAHSEEAQQKMSNFLANSQCEGAMIETVMRGGNVVDEIVNAIDELGVSLVVMATAGGKGLKEKYFGTRTEAIAKRGLCSVLVLPENGPIKPIEHIVYAADFENGDQVTVLQLMQLKELFNATLTFLHIKSKNQPDLIDDEYVKEELIKQFPQADIQFVEIANDDVVEGITRFVQETNTSLLSFTMLNRIFLENITHNSVSAKLLRNLNLPMLALPENGRLLDLQRNADSERRMDR